MHDELADAGGAARGRPGMGTAQNGSVDTHHRTRSGATA
jgi:hypothetical protein